MTTTIGRGGGGGERIKNAKPGPWRSLDRRGQENFGVCVSDWGRAEEEKLPGTFFTWGKRGREGGGNVALQCVHPRNYTRSQKRVRARVATGRACRMAHGEENPEEGGWRRFIGKLLRRGFYQGGCGRRVCCKERFQRHAALYIASANSTLSHPPSYIDRHIGRLSFPVHGARKH